jgi:predicted O-linked N-acetylglucosamine transferase (SPINDLY family)
LSKNLNLELYIYHNSDLEDHFTEKFKRYIKNWKNIYNIDDRSTLKLIRSDKINILIDLSGYTKGNRLEVFFNRAAPIQISWIGYLCSTGLKEIDYVFGDNNVITKKEETQFVEKIYKLNNTWTVLSQPDFEIPVSKNLPYLKNKYITFGSFNNILKVNSKVIQAWSRILCNIMESKIILIDKRFKERDFKEYFINLFINHGVIKSKKQLNFNLRVWVIFKTDVVNESVKYLNRLLILLCIKSGSCHIFCKVDVVWNIVFIGLVVAKRFLILIVKFRLSSQFNMTFKF